MKVWRIDATYAGEAVHRHSELVEPVEGMLTLFAVSDHYREQLVRRLADAGWEYDVYQEEVGELSEAQRELLVVCPWPVFPTAQLCALAGSPKAAARERLAEILDHRQAKQEGA